jgi:gliding motility-associated-like protein
MGAGSYTLTISDDFGCSFSVDITIVEPEELIFAELGVEPAYCRLFPYQSGNGVVFAAATGGTPDYTYEWKDSLTGETTNNTTWGGLNPGIYVVTVTDDAGCVLTQEIVLDSLNPIADFDMTSPQFESEWAGTLVMDIHFVNTSQNFSNPNDPLADTTFFWNFESPNAPWIISHDYYETFDTSYGVAGTYNVCLVAQNKNGCTDTTCKEITVYDIICLAPVNVFTPDGDGINDIFTFDFYAKSISTFHCVIVDRWGNTKFEMNSLEDGWNGKDKTGDQCRDGVYFYTYDAVSDNGTALQGQGTVQLLSK